MNHTRSIFFCLLLLFAAPIGCASNYLRSDEYRQGEEGFKIADDSTIADTAENRAILDTIARYRLALVRKDIGVMKSLISKDYYDNAGTTDTTSDDYGNNDLPAIFELLAKHTSDIKYDISIVNLTVDGRNANVDYKFQYAYHFLVDGKPSWDAGEDVNRISLANEGGTWRILSGL